MTPAEGMRFESGAIVEVRNRFDGDWCPGFQVERAVTEGYLLRRCRDGALLPTAFDDTAVRVAPPPR